MMSECKPDLCALLSWNQHPCDIFSSGTVGLGQKPERSWRRSPTPFPPPVVSALSYQTLVTSFKLHHPSINMDAPAAGSSKRSTVYVAGLAPEVNEQQLLDAFVTFGTLISTCAPSLIHPSKLIFQGDILEISIPPEANERERNSFFPPLLGASGSPMIQPSGSPFPS